MISRKFHYVTSILLIGATILTSCSEDDGDTTPGTSPDVLTADAGSAQSAMPGQDVTLDASNSTGTNLNYEWEFSGPGSITLSDGTVREPSNGTFSNESGFTFSAQVTGEYFFSLRITSGNEFSQASVTVTVAGALELTSLAPTDGSSTLKLSDVNLDDSPDYIVNSVLTLPENIWIEFDGNITIAFADGAGLKLAGSNFISTNSQLTFEPVSAGWKGVLAEGNVEFTGSLVIDGAGTSTFDGMEAAAINSLGTFKSGFVQFKNSTGYDLIISDAATELASGGFIFSSQTPLKMPFRLIPSIAGISVEYPNDALITLSADVNSQLSTGASGGYTLVVKSDILITGGLHVNSNIRFSLSSGHHTLFMEENTSLISSNSFRVTGNSESILTITGQNDSKWNGLHLSGNNHLEHVIIKNAGANPISSGSISGITEKTSIYLNGSLDILKNATITDGGGYGLYVSSFGFLAGGTGGSPRYDNYTISNHPEPAISAQRNQAYHMSEGTLTISTPTDVAAIEVRNTSTAIPNNSNWNGLGDGNFYQFEGDLTVGNGSSNSTLNIGAGAHFKFNTDNKIFVESLGTLNATGTVESPIILDGNTDWAGVLVGGSSGSTIRTSNCSFDFVTVQNGGSTALTIGASTAGVYVQTMGTLSFTNCTFKDNTGYGVILESNSTVFDFNAAENGNTFSGNSIGDLVDNATDSDGDGTPDSSELPSCILDPGC